VTSPKLGIILVSVVIMLVPPAVSADPCADSMFFAPKYIGAAQLFPAWPQSVAVGDYDGDGDVDLAVVTRELSYLSVLLGNGDGTFGADCYAGCWPNVSTPIGQPGSIIASHLNGDPNCDIVIAFESRCLVVGVSKGDSTFDLSAPYVLGGNGSMSDLLPADYDGDGDIDFVASITVNRWNNDDDSVLVAVFLNDGAAAFVVDTVDLDAPGTATQAGDFDGDGDTDVLLRSMHILANNGDGTFAVPDSIACPAVGNAVCADLDEDNDIDIVAITSDSAFYVLNNDGDGLFAIAGTFFTPPTYPAGGRYCRAQTIGDFDGDGDPDLAIRVVDTMGYENASIQIYVNADKGVFEYCQEYSLANFVGPPHSYDVTGDGIADLVIPVADGLYPDWGYLVLLNSRSSTTDIDAPDSGAELPDRCRLYQNYPNPFNPTTLIEFDLPRRSYVRIDIYDIIGRRVRTLGDSEFAAGLHQVEWCGDDYSGKRVAGGVYFYRLTTAEGTETRKMMLLK